MAIENQQISNLIADQFPKFYQEDGPNFIAFVEAYYEWMEQTGHVIGDSRNLLSYRDIDTTLSQFLSHFSAKYLYGIPDKIKFDKRFLIKHVLDIYRAKGTIRGYKLLFKLLYNEDITIYLPSRDIFTTSDGQWYQPQYLEVSDVDITSTYVGQIVRGTTSNAYAVVDQFIQQPGANLTKNILYLTDIEGNFVRGEKLVPQQAAVTPNIMSSAPTITGSFTSLNIVNGGQGFSIGDTLIILDGTGTEGEALITKTANGTGTLAFSILTGGNLYSMDADAIITRTVLDANNTAVPRLSTNVTPSGSGGSFEVGAIINVQNLTYSEDIILDWNTNTFASGVNNIAVLTGGSGYANAQPLVFTNRWHLDTFNHISAGINYSNGDSVVLTGGSPTITPVAVAQTDDRGRIVAIDILNHGSYNAQANVTATITSTKGTGAVWKVNLANTGSGATGYVVTNNSNTVTQARVANTGSGYLVPPIITVANTTGTGATFSANVQYDYTPETVEPGTNRTPFDRLFTYDTKQFGTIASLTNISTGNNYVAQPTVTMRDFIDSKIRPGTVYYANTGINVRGVGTKFTNDFVVGDFIKLKITTNPDDDKIYEYRIVTSVANDTSLTLDDNPKYSANGNIAEYFITNGGANYKNTDTVSVSGNSGAGGSFTIRTDNNGTVVNINAISFGSGYTSPPTIKLNSNTGTGATFYATLQTSQYFLTVSTITSNYLPKIDLPAYQSFDANNVPGENAKITANPVFGQGIIAGVTVKNSGVGYLDGDYVRMATYGALTDVTIVDGGTGYSNNQTLVFNGGSSVTEAKGAITTDSNGKITDINMIYPGSGYKYVPNISIISRIGNGAIITADIGGLNTKYNLSGYISLGGIGTLKGRWQDTKSFVSSNKYLQDSYYYQPFSYEIQCTIPFSEYEKTVKKVYHVLGTEMFGRLIKVDYSLSAPVSDYTSVSIS